MRRTAPRTQSHATEPAASPGSIPSAPDCQTAFQSIATSCVNLIQHHRKAAIAADPEALHSVRIELTRLRAAVLFFSPMTDDDAWPEIKKELRWLNSALGKARDQDVTVSYSRRKRYRRWARNSRRAIMQVERKLDRKLNKTLASVRCNGLMTALNDWIANGPWLKADRSVRCEHADAFAQAKLKAWRQEVSREGQHLRDLRRKELHHLRIRCKRYRYVVAALQSLGISIARQELKFADVAKRVHGALGDLRDLRRLRRVAQERPPGYRKSKAKFIQIAEKSLNLHREAR
jgi:CHAD domain-containing protein